MKIEVIKVFISCPEDIVQETTALNIIKIKLDNINNHYKIHGLQFDLIHWKNDLSPRRGEPRVQDSINKRLIENCDIFLGILWTKFGSSPGVSLEGEAYSSGTEEEFYFAQKMHKEPRILFCTIPVSHSKINPQLAKEIEIIRSFKDNLEKEDICYGSYEDDNELKKHLDNIFLSWIKDRYNMVPREREKKEEPVPIREDFLSENKGF